MKEWKQSAEVNSVHDDIYKPSNPNDESSDTYLTLIFKSTFSEKEQTTSNAIWTQSVLESIFDVDYLSSKIDTDVIEMWINAIKQVIFIINWVAFLSY